MREIKFRAWDGYKKDMVPFERSVANFSEGKLYELHPELKVMQFTGLHDKNGKEIYEGDILARYGEVVWVDHAFWCVEPNELGEDKHFWPEDKHFWPNEKNREVIGNRFENPELLK